MPSTNAIIPLPARVGESPADERTLGQSEAFARYQTARQAFERDPVGTPIWCVIHAYRLVAIFFELPPDQRDDAIAALEGRLHDIRRQVAA